MGTDIKTQNLPNARYASRRGLAMGIQAMPGERGIKIMPQNQNYDVIIVGAGAAGLYAALNLPKEANILLLSKKELTLSNSSLAQGGVASVVYRENDDPELHFQDTLVAGKHRNNPEAVRVLVNEGPRDVLNIQRLGVDFDLTQDGKIQMTLEAGHSRHRIAHHKDSTGKEIVDKLLSRVKKLSNVTILENALLFALKPAENGFYAGIQQNGNAFYAGAAYVLLATGGIGRIYQYTTNSAIATGDGIMFAYELGAEIKHLSWIQFHPTAFAAEKDRERFLISEAVRGEGAHLLNCYVNHFTSKYDPRGDLAPRDVVSNAIMQEMAVTGSDRFYLDITYKDPKFLKNRFPMIYERCLTEGIDITSDWIPVFPCQHYLMGGVNVDLNARTRVPRLYAAGECSHTGVHGKNRLASNSLLEALVFGRRAAQDISAQLKSGRAPLGPAPQKESLAGKPLHHGYRTKIREILQKAYFVIPKPEAFAEGLKTVNEILQELETGGYAVNQDFVEAKSAAVCAKIILSEVLQENDA